MEPNESDSTWADYRRLVLNYLEKSESDTATINNRITDILIRLAGFEKLESKLTLVEKTLVEQDRKITELSRVLQDNRDLKAEVKELDDKVIRLEREVEIVKVKAAALGGIISFAVTTTIMIVLHFMNLL